MQKRPDVDTLLAAAIFFLEHDIKHHLSDPAITFRAIVAARLLTAVRIQIRQRSEIDGNHLDEEPLDRRWLADPAFLESVRTGRVSAEEQKLARSEVKESLRQRLRLLSPQFDLTDTVGD
ncbi:MAG: hypothetical protein HUU55_16120 [Myxococcales bacterium]|nr:hypothetical protein [Myxococcales bacterium]